MIFNGIKLESAVFFIEHISCVVPLIFPTLIDNRMVLLASNLLNLLKLVENELEKTFSKGIYNIAFCIRFFET